MLWHALLGAVLAVTPVAHAVVLRPKWTSCAADYQPVDPATQFQITDVLATLVGGADAPRLNLPGEDDVLRLDIFGSSPKENTGYNNTNLKLGGCGGNGAADRSNSVRNNLRGGRDAVHAQSVAV